MSQKTKVKLDALKKMISEFRDKKTGKLKDGYLQETSGKKILKQVTLCKFNSWLEIEEVLERSTRVIKKAFGKHKLKKIDFRKETAWTKERLELMEDYYKNKAPLIKSSKELTQLVKNLLTEVNALPGSQTTRDALFQAASRFGFGRLNWTSKNRKEVQTKIIQNICSDISLTPGQKKSKIFKELGISSMDSLRPKLREAGCSLNQTGEPQGIDALGSSLHDFVMHRVTNKILVDDELGFDALFAEVKDEFGDLICEKKISFTKTAFREKLEEFIWTPSIDKALKEVVKNHLDDNLEESFHSYFSYIPFPMVKSRARLFRGVSRTKRAEKKTALKGFGRVRLSEELTKLVKFRMPRTSFTKPKVIPTKGDSKNWSISFLNGANIGTLYGGDIEENVPRRALADAELRGDDAVILTNIISLDTTMAGGPAKVARAMVMGDNVNPDVITDDNYRGEVERILKDKPLDEVIHQTTEELFENVLSGWSKICIKKNDKLEFSGLIYAVLGINEEALIQSLTRWEIRHWVLKKQTKLQVRKKVCCAALSTAEKHGESYESIKLLEEQLENVENELNRNIISTTSSGDYRRFFLACRALVVHKIEQAIPNSKVIGQNTSYIEIGGKKIEINIPSHGRNTDALLSNVASNYGPKILKERLAEATVICHPWATQYRMTRREADYDGNRGSVSMYVAPIAVDDVYLREALRDNIRHTHPLAKAIFNQKFASGVLRLNCINGTIQSEPLSTPSLQVWSKKYPKPRVKKGHIPLMYYHGSKYLWIHTATDQHWGGRGKEFVTCTDTGKRLGMAEAVFHMLRKEGLCEGTNMPVHLYATNDDPTQGQNFPARTQPSPHQKSFDMVEDEVLELKKKARATKNKEKAAQLFELALKKALDQIEVRASDHPEEQMRQMMERHLKNNTDIFSAILRRGEHSKVCIKGVGQFGNPYDEQYDHRDVGFINIGSGNHLEHTVNGELTEGIFYKMYLEGLLGQEPYWSKKKDFLARVIVAPSYSGEAIAWGTIQAPGGYEYGLDLRATPTRMSGWGDPLRGAVNNDPQRGNYSRIFENKLTLKTYGDKHFFAAIQTSYAFYHMCASGTHTDRYGERGFPPNNTGVSFIGLPADGPDAGPILIRILPFDDIKDFVEINSRPFDWAKFLPNPV